MPAWGSSRQRCEGLPPCLRGACAWGGELGGLETHWDRLAVTARATLQHWKRLPPTPGSFHPFHGAEGAGWEPPAWGTGKGLLPSLIPPSPLEGCSWQGVLSAQLFLAFLSPFVSPPGVCCNLLCD